MPNARHNYVFKLEHDVQMLAPCVVQAVPVALTPLEQEQVFCVHTRLEDEEQAVVCLVPVPQDRQPVQVLPFLTALIPTVQTKNIEDTQESWLVKSITSMQLTAAAIYQDHSSNIADIATLMVRFIISCLHRSSRFSPSAAFFCSISSITLTKSREPPLQSYFATNFATTSCSLCINIS